MLCGFSIALLLFEYQAEAFNYRDLQSTMSGTLQSSIFVLVLVLVLALSKPINKTFQFKAEHAYLVDSSFHPSCGEITTSFSDNTGPHSSIEFVLGYHDSYLVGDISPGYH